LLDSTRTIGSTLNTDLGRPKNISAGVLSSYLSGGGIDMNQWYALRATYSRELKVRDMLSERGVRTFVPMMWRKSNVAGKQEKKLVPAVSNLCFVYWTKAEIDEFIRSFGESTPVHYYWDRTAGRPLTIPEKAMEDFITVASSLDEDLIYLTEISEKLREGQIVEVIDGPFKGVKGKVVRIKKNRRVLVELPGFLAVTTNYLNPQCLRLGTEEEGER